MAHNCQKDLSNPRNVHVRCLGMIDMALSITQSKGSDPCAKPNFVAKSTNYTSPNKLLYIISQSPSHVLKSEKTKQNHQPSGQNNGF